MTGRPRRLRKRLRYRDQLGRSQEAHALHWEGFEWDAGAVIVAAVGSWGTAQVWAASEAEGKRVIRHAAAIGGFNPDGEEGAEWIVTAPSGGRVGRSGRMRTAERLNLPAVTKRQGSSGSPLLPDLEPDRHAADP